MKALVTGGAGFIGSHIAEALCKRGANVVVMDDLSDGCRDNLAWRRPGDDLEFVQGDITDEELVSRLMKGCDWVFHHAAIASVPRSVDQPTKTNRVNLTATLGLLAAAHDAGVQRFVFASSSAIYGEAEVAPAHERLPPRPVSPYALQKYAGEMYAQLFHKFHGLETVSLRYFNVFGPRQSYNSPYSGVIARFCKAVLAGEAPTIFGDGQQSRDFVYVANVVSANLLSVERPAHEVAGKVFNIAGGASINLLELIEELSRLTGRHVSSKFGPARPGDVRISQADIGFARQFLGYEVATSWREGLALTLEWYRKRPGQI